MLTVQLLLPRHALASLLQWKSELQHVGGEQAQAAAGAASGTVHMQVVQPSRLLQLLKLTCS